jgi:hypothetical protein
MRQRNGGDEMSVPEKKQMTVGKVRNGSLTIQFPDNVKDDDLHIEIHIEDAAAHIGVPNMSGDLIE